MRPHAALLGAPPEARARPALPRPRARRREPSRRGADRSPDPLQPRLDGLRRARRTTRRSRALHEKGRGFTDGDRRRTCSPRSGGSSPTSSRAGGRLAERGQVELSTTPYYHPILPLVCDTDVGAPRAPGHAAPAALRVARGRALARARGARVRTSGASARPPAGMWPAEGSVSPEAVEVLASEGVRWAASDEGVLLHSLPPGATRLPRALPAVAGARPGRRASSRCSSATAASPTSSASPTRAHRRDARRWRTSSRTSSAIGEAWADDGAAAARRRWACSSTARTPGSTIPSSGRDFLDRLYRRLESQPPIETVTLSRGDRASAPGPAIPRIHSGSWIEASYRIWIGHCRRTGAPGPRSAAPATRSTARRARRRGVAPERDRARAAATSTRPRGPTGTGGTARTSTTELAAEFDGLFRGLRRRACAARRRAPCPSRRSSPSSAPAPRRPPASRRAAARADPPPHPHARRARDHLLRVAGRRPLPARPAPRLDVRRARRPSTSLHYGFDLEALYLRLDPAESPQRAAEVRDARCGSMVLAADRADAVDFPLVADGAGAPGPARGPSERRPGRLRAGARARAPLRGARPRPGRRGSRSRCTSLRGEVEVERLPRYGYIAFTVPDEDFERDSLAGVSGRPTPTPTPTVDPGVSVRRCTPRHAPRSLARPRACATLRASMTSEVTRLSGFDDPATGHGTDAACLVVIDAPVRRLLGRACTSAARWCWGATPAATSFSTPRTSRGGARAYGRRATRPRRPSLHQRHLRGRVAYGGRAAGSAAGDQVRVGVVRARSYLSAGDLRGAVPRRPRRGSPHEDPLTGLVRNRRGLSTKRSPGRSLGHGATAPRSSLVMLDVDRFKTGERPLRSRRRRSRCCARWRTRRPASLRASDLLARGRRRGARARCSPAPTSRAAKLAERVRAAKVRAPCRPERRPRRHRLRSTARRSPRRAPGSRRPRRRAAVRGAATRAGRPGGVAATGAPTMRMAAQGTGGCVRAS